MSGDIRKRPRKRAAVAAVTRFLAANYPEYVPDWRRRASVNTCDIAHDGDHSWSFGVGGADDGLPEGVGYVHHDLRVEGLY